jgi:hypothetical protein
MAEIINHDRKPRLAGGSPGCIRKWRHEMDGLCASAGGQVIEAFQTRGSGPGRPLKMMKFGDAGKLVLDGGLRGPIRCAIPREGNRYVDVIVSERLRLPELTRRVRGAHPDFGPPARCIPRSKNNLTADRANSRGRRRALFLQPAAKTTKDTKRKREGLNLDLGMELRNAENPFEQRVTR